jgi:GC-rich sequence DNA-binding factor
VLERLEDEHVSLLAERRDMIAKRRKADSEDDFFLFLGPLSTQAEPEEVMDDLGRVVPQANPAAARRDRRTARATRHARHRSKPQHSNVDEEEGFSTDSSLGPSDAADFDVAIRKLSADREDILADVRATDFKDPSRGLAKWFGEWRDQYGDIYQGAWGGLGMVGAWEFWVRLEILGWDPLAVSLLYPRFLVR